ncbi:hypothetical protein [Clostridium estertheticum]|nr:hypothetical protein [Clostridium estertheticum]MBU3173330.1 hypothetical protein [Clostridium estertheticum]
MVKFILFLIACGIILYSILSTTVNFTQSLFLVAIAVTIIYIITKPVSR